MRNCDKDLIVKSMRTIDDHPAACFRLKVWREPAYKPVLRFFMQPS